jgi:hypothetical protein
MALARLVLAIRIMAPSLSAPVVTSYAEAVEHASRRHQIDPYLLIAVAAHESRFRARLLFTSGGELYVGLGQIRARNYSACRAGLPTAACQAQIANLQDGSANLYEAARVLQASRTFCRKHLRRRPREAEWLSLYQGYGGRPEVGGGFCLRTKRGGRAKLPHLTRRVLRMRDCLAREVRRKTPRALICYPR